MTMITFNQLNVIGVYHLHKNVRIILLIIVYINQLTVIAVQICQINIKRM